MGTYLLGMHDAVETLADEKTTENSKVLSVDMHSGFKDSFLADQIHYNLEGAAFIANNYFEVLDALLE